MLRITSSYPCISLLLIILIFGVISYANGLEFITDNSDTTACIVIPEDGWYSSTWGGHYGEDKLYTTKGDGSKTVTWITRLPFGRYNVRAWVNTAPYASDAHYKVIHSRGTTQVVRSQNLQSGDWPIDLGTYEFDTIGMVILSDYWTGPELYVVADAIKFVEMSTTYISWATFSPADAIRIAASDNKPVMIYFSTEKSVECQQMESQTFHDPTLAKWAESFVTVHVQAEENPEPLRTYNVFRVPTILLLDPDGTVQERLEGFYPANELVRELNTFLGRIGQ